MRVELINFNIEFANLQEITEPTIVFRNKFHDKGLFSEQIFGPVEDYKCQCGRYSGREYVNKVCENCKVTITKSNIRLTTFAKIVIPEFCCVVNPIVLSMFCKYYLPAKFNKVNFEKIIHHQDVNGMTTGSVSYTKYHITYRYYLTIIDFCVSFPVKFNLV